MKVPFSWLKQYVDIDVTAQELEDKLFGCGFEVEELIDLGGEISKVVVGVVVFHLKSRLPSVTTFDRVYLQNPGRNPPELLALLLLLLPSVQTITKLLLLL